MPSELILDVILVMFAIAANCLYGLLLIISGVAVHDSRRQRLFVVFLGLQGAAALKVEELVGGWPKVMLAGVAIGGLHGLLFHAIKRVGGEPAANAIVIFGIVWWMSAGIAGILRPAVFPPARE